MYVARRAAAFAPELAFADGFVRAAEIGADAKPLVSANSLGRKQGAACRRSCGARRRITQAAAAFESLCVSPLPKLAAARREELRRAIFGGNGGGGCASQASGKPPAQSLSLANQAAAAAAAIAACLAERADTFGAAATANL